MLIVDDFEINREILKILFQKEYEILEADDGEEALAVLESCQGNVDIVLLDLIMPGMEGFEVLKKCKDVDYLKTIPVVVITSSGAVEDQVRAFELGASDYVTKPFVPEIVLSRVNNVMASHRRMLSIELEAQKLKVKSELDQMTGLYNKTTVELMANEALKVGSGILNAMIIIDIDNFKAVNDISGHQAGDHVIRIVADLISSLFRKTDIVGRIGGDEFAVLMVDVPTIDLVRDKVNELIQIMKYKPNLTIPENVTLSIGVASSDRRATHYAEIFKMADEALYRAKQEGKARYCEYGVEPIEQENDERTALLLISRNRNVCSVVNALVPTAVRVVEALTLEDLKSISEKDREKIVMIYADVSDLGDDSKAFWEYIRDISWISKNRCFAICQESNMAQYKDALDYGTADILTTPLDGAMFKRKTFRQLEKLGIVGGGK